MPLPTIRGGYDNSVSTILPEVWTAPRGVSSTESLDQLGVQRDLGVQNLGDRAVLLGVSRHFDEFGFVHVRHLGTQSQGGATDAETLAFRFERDRGLGGELGRGKAGGLQPKCKRHGEASRMRRGD